jgi:hypothetical protein
MMKYKLLPDEHAHKSLEFLKSPFREAYVFTYYYGKQLMHSLLQGPNRYATFQRFLTQQICPSDLLDGWFAYQELEPHYENANRKLAE